MAEADIDAAATIQVEAFGGLLADAVSRYHEGPRYTWRDAWVVETGGEVSAAAIVIPATWWFRGHAYAISAIAGVAVRPIDRRRRQAHQLMHAILEADLALGRAFSLLYPFQHGFYRRLGYGSVGLMHYWRLPTAQLRDEPTLRKRVRVLREADRPSVQALFERSVRERPEGGLERKAGQWQRRWSMPEDHWVVYDDNGMSGYLVYRTAPNSLDLREIVADTSEAERGLWSFVAAQVEQRASATYHAPVNRPLWALLREPYMFDGPEHGFIINDVAGLTMSFMGRAIDWPAAIAPRTFPPEARGRLTLELSDAVYGPRGLALELAYGHGELTEPAATPDVRCDVSTFSQLYCGALSADRARWYGLLEADDAAVTLLDHAFPQGPPFIATHDWF